jgi:hypothetical protein
MDISIVPPKTVAKWLQITSRSKSMRVSKLPSKENAKEAMLNHRAVTATKGADGLRSCLGCFAECSQDWHAFGPFFLASENKVGEFMRYTDRRKIGVALLYPED